MESNSIICLSVKNEFELERLYEKFKDLTQSVMFYEPDVDERTSLCLYGTPEIRKKLRSLPLLLKKIREMKSLYEKWLHTLIKRIKN